MIVEITHPKTGETYRIERRHFQRRKVRDDKSYAELGFKIVTYADGTLYNDYEAPHEPDDDNDGVLEALVEPVEPEN